MATSTVIEQDDLLNEPAVETAPVASTEPKADDKATADQRAQAELETAEFVAEAIEVLELSEAQAALVAEELSKPRLRVLPEAEQAEALTIIRDLARVRELMHSAQRRLAEAGDENHDIAKLIEDARIKAAEYAEAVEEGGQEIERIKRAIDLARESKAEAERRRIDAEVRLERRAHVVDAITGEMAQYAAGESERQKRLSELLSVKKG